METFRKDLEEVNFPVILLKDIPLEVVLLEPGISRLRLLQWCLSEVDYTFKDDLAVGDDHLQNALLEAAGKLGICTEKVEEKSVFLGNGNVKKQTAFWDMMLDLVKALQKSKSYGKTKTPCIDFSSEELDFRPSNVKINLIPVEIQLKLALKDSANSSAPDPLHSLMKPNSKTGSSVGKTNLDCSTELVDRVTSAGEAFKSFNNVFNNELKPRLPMPSEIEELQVENVFSEIIQSVDLVTKNYEAFQEMKREIESVSLNNMLNQVNSKGDNDENLNNRLAECNQSAKELFNELRCLNN